MTYALLHVKAVTVGLTMAVGAQVIFTVCEFTVKYAFSLAMDGGVAGSPGASMHIPSPLSVVAAVVGFAYGYRWTLRKARPHEAH